MAEPWRGQHQRRLVSGQGFKTRDERCRVAGNDNALLSGRCARNDPDGALRHANGFSQRGADCLVGLAVLGRFIDGDAQTLAVSRVDDTQDPGAARAWLDFDGERQTLGVRTPEGQTSRA